jgi:hypothetical protein
VPFRPDPKDHGNGGSYNDLDLDLSILSLITDETTFRVYFEDNNGLVSAAASTATWPYGYRIYGGIESTPAVNNGSNNVPEPSILALMCAGLAGFSFARRHK